MTNIIEYYTGIPSDYIIIGLLAIALLLLIFCIVSLVMIKGIKKRMEIFMKGKNAKSLEDTLIYRLEQVDQLREANSANERNLESLNNHIQKCYNKFGLVKYNALEELGGNLSFALCLLDNRNNGIIMNVVHSREGCYTYIKEVIDGNAIIGLAKEEEEALEKAVA